MSKIYRSPAQTLLLAWLLAGTMDALAAILIYRVPPMSMFRYIASGAFGAEALNGGMGMVLMGVTFHYFIALVWTLGFFVLASRLKFTWTNRFLTGLVYGLLVWVVMNLAVLPLSSAQTRQLTLTSFAIGAGILMFAIGLPIALIVGRYYAQRNERG